MFEARKDFFGTAVWTLTTVLSAFLISFYNQQQQKHYGIYQRRIISYEIGTWMIPACILENVAIVLMMTKNFYSDRIGLFYYRALSSVLLQFILISYCIFITSNRHCLKVIKKLEREWLEKTQKPQRMLHLVPLVLDGEEAINEKFEAILEILIESIGKTQSSMVIPYLTDNIGMIADWMDQNSVDQSFLYDLVERLMLGRWKFERVKFEDVGTSLTFSKRDIILSVLMLTTADLDTTFYSVWETVDHLAKQHSTLLTYPMLRVTIELMITKTSFAKDGIDRYAEKKIDNIFSGFGEHQLSQEIIEKKNELIAYLKRLLITRELSETELTKITERSAQVPIPNINSAVRSINIANILNGG